MKIGIISKSGIGDLIYALKFLPSILKTCQPQTIVFYIKDLNGFCSGRTEIISGFISDLFTHRSENIEVITYESKELTNGALLVHAHQQCDYVIDPLSNDLNMAPRFLEATSTIHLMNQMLSYEHCVLPSIQDKRIFCNFNTSSVPDGRNLSNEQIETIFNMVKDRDPIIIDYNGLDFGIETYSPSICQVLKAVSPINKVYIGVDSWIHAAASNSCNSVTWVAPSAKPYVSTLDLLTKSPSTNKVLNRLVLNTQFDSIVAEIEALLDKY